jgi:HEAT repeat protein
MALGAAAPVERLSALQAMNELGIILEWLKIRELANDTLLQRAVWNAAARLSDVDSAQLLARSISECRESDFPWACAALAHRVNYEPGSVRLIRAALTEFPNQRRTWLHQLLSSELLEHRQAALLVLSLLGGPDAVQAAFDVLDDDALAATAERALTLLQQEAMVLLREKAAMMKRPAEQTLAIEMMGRLIAQTPNAEAMAAICEALNSDNPAVLRAVFELLEHTSDQACLKRTFERFEYAATVVESFAVEALQAMVRRHPAFAHEMVQHAKLNGPDALGAVVAMATLINCAEHDAKERNEFLGRALAHESPQVRRVAIESLASCEDAATTAMAVFALTDEEPQVRRAAVRALGRASDINAIERLIEIVKASDDTDLVVSAVRALGESDNARAMQVLRPVARSGAPVVAVAAVEAIARLSDLRRIDALIDSLSHADAEVVKAALQMLAHESDLRTNAHLGACLDHEAWDVRRLAADLLGRIGGESVTALLRTKLALEPEPLVRDAILRALGDADASNYVCRNTPCADVGSWRPK